MLHDTRLRFACNSAYARQHAVLRGSYTVWSWPAETLGTRGENGEGMAMLRGERRRKVPAGDATHIGIRHTIDVKRDRGEREELVAQLPARRGIRSGELCAFVTALV